MPGEITYTDEELVARLRMGTHIERKAAEVIERLLGERDAAFIAAVEASAKVAETLLGGGPYQAFNEQFAAAIRRLTPESWVNSDGRGCAQHSEGMRR